MTTSPVVLATEGLDDFVDSAGASLSTAFGAPFDFWLLEGETPLWLRASSEGHWPLEQGLPLQAAPGGETPSLAIDVATQLRAAREPILLDQRDGRVLLGVPLGMARGCRLAATASLPASSTELAMRLARLFLNHFRLQQEVDRCREDLDACAAQIGCDFEELTFLRMLTDHLDISDTQETWQVAEMVLPLLASVVQAESLVLVRAHPQDEDARVVSVDRAVAWVGPRRFNDDECWRFIDNYRTAAVARPLVKNHFSASPDATEFPGIHKFILVTVAKGQRVLGWLAAINHTRKAKPRHPDVLPGLSQFEFGTIEAGLLNSVASMLATHARNVELFREKEALLINVVRAMVSAIDAKDPYTCGHSERVALVSRHLGMVLGLDDLECERVYLAALLHDLGKLGVPDAVLRKPGRLTPEEMDEIRPHPERGWAILQDLDQLRHLVPGVLHHHERYDGAGYPDGLAGEDIPMIARILAVADGYDAMVSDRPYRRGMPHDKVEQILREGSGNQWDPKVIEAFFVSLDEIQTIWQTYQPQTPRLRQREAARQEVECGRT
jgi:HD-GYP domain-containing protein (c-di-GMP phosphodiesterase class II)